jgi:chromosome segregation ATPase
VDLNEIVKLTLTGLFSSGFATVLVGVLHRRKAAAEAKQIAANTDLLEQQIRATLTRELAQLHQERQQDQQRIMTLELELSELRRLYEAQGREMADVKRRLAECEDYRRTLEARR